MFISYLGARLTLEEAAETFSRLLPLGMSGRQTLNLLEPVGKALAAQEDELVKVLFEQATQKASSEQEQAERLTTQTLERMYIELDGILARLRRGSVPMEEKEQKRKGDVYREIKVGAVFRAERGRERSELAPEVWVDTPQAGSMRYVARRTAKGGFGPLLYCLALQGGLREAKQVVVLGDGRRGSGSSSPNSSQARCRLSISTMPNNTSGKSPTPSLDTAVRRPQAGLSKPVGCSFTGRSRSW